MAITGREHTLRLAVWQEKGTWYGSIGPSPSEGNPPNCIASGIGTSQREAILSMVQILLEEINASTDELADIEEFLVDRREQAEQDRQRQEREVN